MKKRFWLMSVIEFAVYIIIAFMIIKKMAPRLLLVSIAMQWAGCTHIYGSIYATNPGQPKKRTFEGAKQQKPDKMRFLFEFAGCADEIMPIKAIHYIYYRVCSSIILDVLVIVILRNIHNNRLGYDILRALFYYEAYEILAGMVYFGVYSFFLKYKRLNGNNFKYLVNHIFHVDGISEEPVRRKIGHGKVMKLYKRGFRRYAVVQTRKAIIKDALVYSDRSEFDEGYVFELCGVSYITAD